MDNLSHLKICIEKLLPEELNVRHALKKKANSSAHLEKLSAAFFTSKLWPKGQTIKISFVNSDENSIKADWTPIAVLKSARNNDGSSPKLDPLEYTIRKLSPIEAVKKIVRDRIQPMTGLNFKFVPQGGNIRVAFDPNKGANSLIGTDCLKSKEAATMNLGWLDASTIIHEFGHAIGLIHEHQNPGGKGISWNDSVVYAWAKQTQGWDEKTTFHNIIERYDSRQINGSDYDPKSIMLYFFPSKLTTDGVGTDANRRLSITDVEYTHKIYNTDIDPVKFWEQMYGEETKLKPQGSNGRSYWSGAARYALIFAVVIIAGFALYYGIRYIKNKSMKSLDYDSSYKSDYNPLRSQSYRSNTHSSPVASNMPYYSSSDRPSRSLAFKYSPTTY